MNAIMFINPVNQNGFQKANEIAVYRRPTNIMNWNEVDSTENIKIPPKTQQQLSLLFIRN